MAGTVVDNPKDPMGMAVGILIHDLVDQAVEGDNGAARLATAIDLSLVDIPGSQIGPGSEASILMLDLEGRVGPGRQREEQAMRVFESKGSHYRRKCSRQQLYLLGVAAGLRRAHG